MSLKKDDFSLQVIKEQQDNGGSLLECIEIIRQTHGYEPSEVKKFLTNNLYGMLEEEAQKNNTIEKNKTNSLETWIK